MAYSYSKLEVESLEMVSRMKMSEIPNLNSLIIAKFSEEILFHLWSKNSNFFSVITLHF